MSETEGVTRRTFFFSWQSDTPGKTGHYFIRDALKAACAEVSAELEAEEPERDESQAVEYDSDTLDEPGHPPIFETILNKIERATAFVADFTYVAGNDKRRLPNPNVGTEYGYAYKVLGYRRMILVMNTAHGDPEKWPLPFDMRHFTRPVQFNLPDEASKEEIEAAKKKLVPELKRRIRSILKILPPEERPAPVPFPEVQPADGPSKFRIGIQPLGNEDFPLLGKREKVWLGPGPTIWLRLIPQEVREEEFSIPELKAAAERGGVWLMPMTGESPNTLRGADGFGYFSGLDAEKRTALSAAYVFNTGEIWSIDTWLFAGTAAEKRFPIISIMQVLAKAMERYGVLLKNLGFEPPYRWIAGVDQVQGRFADGGGGLFASHECMVPTIQESGVYDGVTPARQVLFRLERQLYLKCGLNAPQAPGN